MALKKPIIAIKGTGGMIKVIKNHCGIVVDKISPEMLANAVIKLYKNPELRKFYGEKGFLIQSSKYDSKIAILKIKNLIKKTLKKR